MKLCHFRDHHSGISAKADRRSAFFKFIFHSFKTKSNTTNAYLYHPFLHPDASFPNIPLTHPPTRVATIWLECSVALHHALRINLRLEPFFMSREKKEVLQLGRLGAAMREIVVRVTRCPSQIRILASGETEFSMVLDIYQYTLQDRSGPAHFDDFNCLRE